MILGIAALISPIGLAGQKPARDVSAMLAAALALYGLGLAGEVGRWAGAGLVVLLVVYLVWSALSDHADADPSGAGQKPLPLWREIASILAGLLFLIWGGDLLVSSATSIARSLGLSEAVIGLTIVAVGTSLPELATSVIAALRKQSGIAVGNVIGSNISTSPVFLARRPCSCRCRSRRDLSLPTFRS